MSSKKVYVKFFDGSQIGEGIYFFNMTFNAIMYLNLNNYSLKYAGNISAEKKSQKALSTGMNYRNKDIIYFFPNNTNVIMKFDVINKKDGTIPIKGYKKEIFRTIGYVYYQNKIYIFPYELEEGIYVLDLFTQKVYKDRELSKLFKSNLYCASVFLIEDSIVLISISGSSKIIEIDIKNKKIIRKYELENNINIDNMCFDGTHFWIMQRGSTDIYEWDIRNNCLEKYENINVVWDDQKYMNSSPYSRLIFLKDEILVLNCFLKNILKINKKNKTIENIVDFPKGFNLVNKRFAGWPVCNSFKIVGDKVLIYPSRGNMLLIYDINTKQLSGKELFVLEKDVPYLNEVIEEIFLDKILHSESDELETLCNFLDTIGQEYKKEQEKNEQIIGNMIFNRMKVQ